MKTARWVAAAALAGALAGAGLTAWWAASSQEGALRAQRAELDRLKAQLSQQEDELARGRDRMTAEAEQFRRAVSDAVGRTDALVKAEGTAVEKLKKITAGLRTLRDDLASLN